MTPEQRIARHVQTIKSLKQDIEWLKESQFSIGDEKAALKPGWNTDALIEHELRIISMHEHFIEMIAKRAASNA